MLYISDHPFESQVRSGSSIRNPNGSYQMSECEVNHERTTREARGLSSHEPGSHVPKELTEGRPRGLADNLE